MPHPGIMNLSQYATVWKRIGTDLNARPIVSSVAETIRCRWDGSKRNVSGPNGEPIRLDATLFVEAEIRIGSAVTRGTIDDLPGTGQTPERDVYEVVSYEEIPDIRGVHVTRKVGLVKGSDTLSTTGTDPES